MKLEITRPLHVGFGECGYRLHFVNIVTGPKVNNGYNVYTDHCKPLGHCLRVYPVKPGFEHETYEFETRDGRLIRGRKLLPIIRQALNMQYPYLFS